MSNSYGIDAYVADLRRITAGTTDESEIIEQLCPHAQRLATDKSWLKPEHSRPDPEQGIGVHLLHEETDHTLAVFVVSWEPGRGAPPHDHGTWAVVAGIDGDERNISYARLDDRSRAGYAEIEVKKETVAGPGDLICMKTGGIHSITNDSDRVTLSLHTYGKHVNYTERSQFDPTTNSAKDFKVTLA